MAPLYKDGCASPQCPPWRFQLTGKEGSLSVCDFTPH